MRTRGQSTAGRRVTITYELNNAPNGAVVTLDVQTNKTGEVTVADEEIARQQSFDRGYVLNTSTMKFHYPSCSSVEKMAEHNKEYVEASREELIEAGYEPCGNCEP